MGYRRDDIRGDHHCVGVLLSQHDDVVLRGSNSHRSEQRKVTAKAQLVAHKDWHARAVPQQRLDHQQHGVDLDHLVEEGLAIRVSEGNHWL